MIEVKGAEYLNEYKIRVEFNDGESGVVDLKPDLWGPVFSPLLDLNRFRRFHVSRDFGTLVWEDGVDFAPEHLYKRVTEAAINK